MDILNFLKEQLHIDGVIVLIVIASGFFQQKYLCGLRLSTDDKTDSALRTLVLSGAVVAIMLFLTGAGKDDIWPAFLSYFLATSFYELIVRPITKFIKKNLDDDDSTKP